MGRSNAVALGLGRPDPTPEEWILVIKNLNIRPNFLFSRTNWKKRGFCLLIVLKLVFLSGLWCSWLQMRESGMWTARLPISGPWIVLWYDFFICCLLPVANTKCKWFLLNSHRGSCRKREISTSFAFHLFLLNFPQKN